jgi:hypothetical protein
MNSTLYDTMTGKRPLFTIMIFTPKALRENDVCSFVVKTFCNFMVCTYFKILLEKRKTNDEKGGIRVMNGGT